jgi:peptidoglycan/LPS O-acetylase OafA/YrhL
MRRIPELDGVRGIAILMVIIWHYFNCQIETVKGQSQVGELLRLTSWSWSGVDLFFVLSGFLIGGIIIDNRESKNFLAVFYTRRALRIVPVYCLLLVSFFVLRSTLDAIRYNWLFGGSIPDWSYLTYTQNILMAINRDFGGNFLAITWSLGVEEQFYLVVPFLCLVLPRKYWISVAILLTVSAPILRSVINDFSSRFVLTPCRMDALFLGALGAGTVRNLKIRRYLIENRCVLRLSLLALAIPIGIIVLQGKADLDERLDHALLAGFYVVLVMIAVLESGNAWVFALRMPALRFLGLISYSLYLFHQAVAGLMHGTILNRAPSLETYRGRIVTLISLVVSVSLAAISYYLVERYFVKLGRSNSYEKNSKRAEFQAFRQA